MNCMQMNVFWSFLNVFFRFIGEESTAGGKKIEYTDAPTWIIDPIDGTTNFVHRCELYCHVNWTEVLLILKRSKIDITVWILAFFWS